MTLEKMALDGEACHKKRKLENEMKETEVVPVEHMGMTPIEIDENDGLLRESQSNHQEIVKGLESIADAVKAMHSDMLQLYNDKK